MRGVLLLVILAACEAGTINDTMSMVDGAVATVDATPPSPSGCVDDVSTGDHVYTCEGLRVDARIPAQCQTPGCGLILELHGDTGSGLLMDGHTKLRELGAQNGYIVIAPSGPPWPGPQGGSTWTDAEDAKLVAMTQLFAQVYRVDAKKIHVTGFSRGGFVTWRLLCDHSDLFVSVAPGGAGYGSGFGETTCFDSTGHAPAIKRPILFLMGRTDASVGYSSLTQIRDAAVGDYNDVPISPMLLDGDGNYMHQRFGAGIETFEHAYETVSDGPFASAKGHCIPGSTTDPYAAQYAIPCELPNAFVWGEQVMAFFLAHHG